MVLDVFVFSVAFVANMPFKVDDVAYIHAAYF